MQQGPTTGSFSIEGVRAFTDSGLRDVDVTVADGRIVGLRPAARRTPERRLLLLPGLIDGHVHFREPGLTHKADIAGESRAAAAGGVTTVLDMPNVVPTTTTPEALAEKHRLFRTHCVVNYGLFYGITNTNVDEALRLPQDQICGYKVFLGSSTGGMLVDDAEALCRLMKGTRRVIAVHAEDESMIRAARARLLAAAGPDAADLPVGQHPLVRSAEACLSATRTAVEAALRYGAHLHLCHVTTAAELDYLRRVRAQLEAGRTSVSQTESGPSAVAGGIGGTLGITAEACIAHLWFTDADYARLGTRIKCNPAVKTAADRTALRRALRDGTLDTVATDHAPHLLADKDGGALRAASGMPSVQFLLPVLLELVRRGVCSLADVVRLACVNPARRFGIEGRDGIRVGNAADLVLVDPTATSTVTAEALCSKCGWSPFEGVTFHHKILHTWCNGKEVWHS